MASLEQWGTIMFTACDTVGPGQAPVRNANVYAALYFVAFLFIVCFFIQVSRLEGRVMDSGSQGRDAFFISRSVVLKHLLMGSPQLEQSRYMCMHEKPPSRSSV